MASLLIVIDAGHGGWDNGASSYEGRREKDDNLRLSLEVERQLRAQGINVLMTRDTDEYITLQDRARIANEAGADLFVSIHRNSYTQPTAWTNGVENYIYLTAPEATAGRAAQLVLDAVVDVGVQSNRGLKRGNYYVLRRTNMPAMLLEMGYMINDIDNQLFDEHLSDYAVAIAKGVMEYFGLTYQPIPGVTPPAPPTLPPSPVGPPGGSVGEAQAAVNQRYGANMPISGAFDTATKQTMTRLLQQALNTDLNAGVPEDGVLGADTLSAIPNVQAGQQGNLVFLIQALLVMNGYETGTLDGIFGSATTTAVQLFQRDRYLTPDGIAGATTIRRLLGAS